MNTRAVLRGTLLLALAGTAPAQDTKLPDAVQRARHCA
jgi:hypothetical protein